VFCDVLVDVRRFLSTRKEIYSLHSSRTVIFRVGGTDDKLLLHALLALKFSGELQRPSQCAWSDFKYNCNSCSVLMWDRKDSEVLSESVHDARFMSFFRSLQASAKVKDFDLRCLDLDDHDLKAFETRSEQRPVNKLSLVTWRWGRAIDNYLLPATAPAALYLRAHAAVSKLTSEVFVTIARHFFPAVSEAESRRSNNLCGHPELKHLGFYELIGTGWKAWSSLLQTPDIDVHQDADTKAAAECLKKFSISVLAVATLLDERHGALYGSGGCRAGEWLLRLAALRRQVRGGKHDIVNETPGKSRRVEGIDWKGAFAAMPDASSVQASGPLNRGDADDTAMWFNLPAVCSFLANLSSCRWPSDSFDDPASATAVKDAAVSALCLIQHALCVLLLGCDPALPAPQCTLLTSAECLCFLPLVVENCAVRCINCGRDDTLHTLPQHDSSGAVAEDFLVELCRVGSVGWQSNGFVNAVYNRTHLGVSFTEENVDELHRLYEQLLRSLLHGGADSEHCHDLTVSALPDITVFTMTDGEAKKGRMEPLLEQRRAEMHRLCEHIAFFIAPSKASASLFQSPVQPSQPLIMGLSDSDDDYGASKIPDDCKVLGRILRDLGALQLLQKFTDIGENDSNLNQIHQFNELKIMRLYSMPKAIAIPFIERCRNVSAGGGQASAGVDANLWLKGCLILEACTKGIKSFVSNVMKQLHSSVLDEVKHGITQDLGVCEVEDFFLNWNCSSCREADADDAPVSMCIRALDANGVVHCDTPHRLPPNKLNVCYLRNIPSGLLSDSHAIAKNVPLLLCRSPDDPADSKEFKSSKLILLHSRAVHFFEPHLIPFRVQICRSSGEELEFYTVLCFSCPSHTKQIVESFLSHKPLTALKGDVSTFRFWTLNKIKEEESKFEEVKHNLKFGDLLRFVGADLPNCIMAGQRYFVSETTKWSFNICGPIVCPISPLTPDAAAPFQPSLVLTRRSPISRCYNGIL
jgi:hypothetical protein